MKTVSILNILSNNDNKYSLVKSIKITLAFTMLCVVCFNGNAQTQFGIEATSSVTGSGQGAQHSPRVFYKYQKSAVAIGPIIQKQGLNFSGLQIEYQYNLYGDDHDIITDNLELFCFINSIYNNTVLSKNEIKREGILSSDKSNSFINFKYKTVENYIGLGLRLKITNDLLWLNAIGFGAYYSFENNHNVYHNQKGVALLLRTGLVYCIGK